MISDGGHMEKAERYGTVIGLDQSSASIRCILRVMHKAGVFSVVRVAQMGQEKQADHDKREPHKNSDSHGAKS
jgi:hypothetical protein